MKNKYTNFRSIHFWLFVILAYSGIVFLGSSSYGQNLSNTNATPEAKALYAYIKDMYGKKILSGQQDSPWGVNELTYIQTHTGKQPAIRGLDYITDSDNNGETQRAIDWWRKGGIPTIMWHMGAPGKGEGYASSQLTIDINRCFTPGTAEYNSFWYELDRKADQLEKLKNANVPVLWRPFHELNGGWFWWGKGGPEQFKRLWIAMYNYMVVERKLDNLIWVLCYTGDPNGAWFPGRQYVDIGGADTYGSGSDPKVTMFNRTKTALNGYQLPIAYHECGTPPNPDQCLSQNAMWSWWMEWHTSHLEGVDRNYLRTVYNHNLVITLDEIPNIMAVYGNVPQTNVAPTVNITAPINNASVNAPANITVTANAADIDGTISKVEFFNGTTKVGEDLSNPYSITIPGLPSGTYSLTARATDNAGSIATSSIVRLVVSPCTPTPVISYVKINTGSWSTGNTANLNSGGTVLFGPQPLTGGSWKWSGPNAFSATTREISLANIQASQEGIYVASYTNTAGCITTQNFTVTVITPCTPSPVISYVRVNDSAWTASNTATLNVGSTLIFGPYPAVGGSWSWTGPNAFTASTREISLGNIQVANAGTYTATHTNAGGCITTGNITVSVIVPCTPTVTTPYTRVNSGAWVESNSATLNAGGTVMFGPQPSTGGSWRWTGPNAFMASTREMTLTNVQSAQVGNYIATYTNAAGCSSTTTFKVALNTPAGCGIASNNYPICCSAGSDPDGDGWGWENNASCYVTTPPVTNGLGFTIAGTQLRDANGNNFIMKGINVPLSWFVSDVNNNIANIRNRTNANTLRIVVNTSTSDAAWQTAVQRCIDNNIIPMLELHDVTGSNSSTELERMGSWWASKASFLTRPAIARYILVNIANEWGDWYMSSPNNAPDGTVWRNAYINAIRTMRNAGIKTTIVVDAPGYGQDNRANTLLSFAPAVQAADPLHNILFSVHMYCEWGVGGNSNVTTHLPAIKNAGLPIIIGEFGFQHSEGSGICDINETQIINTAHTNGIGWLAWSWKGNGSGVGYLDLSNDWAGTSLTTWGNTVVNGTNGTKTAVTASVFTARQVSSSRDAVEKGTSIVGENPTIGAFFITMNNDVSNVIVNDSYGRLVYSKDYIVAGSEITFGESFSGGTYFVQIYYTNGSSEVKRVLKLN